MIDFLLDKGIVPEWALRRGIRALLAARLASEARRKDSLPQILQSMKEGPIALQTTKANDQHYEVPAEFFKLVLGKRLKYSSGYWYGSTQKLSEAEENMLDLASRRADLAQGQKILELGCGWGSFSLWMAESFSRAQIVGVTNSKIQKEYIDGQIRERGLKNVSILTADMNSFDTTEEYDRVVSVEMFERMRNWERLLEKVSIWLRPGGLFFMHIFTHRDYAYFFDVPHFFTNGLMPSDGLPAHFQQDLSLINHWFVPGTHYSQTARAWLDNLNASEKEVLRIFSGAYGPANAGKWLERWRLFFMACEELLGYALGTEWQVSHYLFRKS